ncbi:unnamed protein product [Medioppia subpectinata]|uniref:Uncharacterized protein n=1 Tax=Medioppia subpectinata TaxID=1979941 RepID=A0A7R9QMK3_9ACAR|nr:unnamed protein product [Medioppia subpectinata]CAG2122878.1 unnamed protein product [Medioppia subpectinata]
MSRDMSLNCSPSIRSLTIYTRIQSTKWIPKYFLSLTLPEGAFGSRVKNLTASLIHIIISVTYPSIRDGTQPSKTWTSPNL